MSSGGGAAGGGGGGGGGSGGVTIPNNVRKTIQNIKEITGNHSEEDIYAMLKECSMDPNETADKLLLQDTFHEVKRKRDRRKENLNKEPAELRWKPGMQGRGSRGGRGASSSRNSSHEAGGRNLPSGKDNGPSQVIDKGGNVSSLATAQVQVTKSKGAISSASSLAASTNGPTEVATGNISANDPQTSTDSAAGKSEGLLTPAETKKDLVVAPVSEDQSTQQVSGSSNFTAVQSSGAYFSASDPLLLPSQDSRNSNAVGTIRREVASQRVNIDQIPPNSDKNKSTSASDSESSIVQGKLPSKVHGAGRNHHLESSQNSTSAHASSSVSRPSSNYNNRSQVIGSQKVGPSKEWKPKSTTNPNLAQGSGAAASSEAPTVAVEASASVQPTSSSLDSKEANVELERKLDEFHISDGQHVIIPNHLHVPEADKLGFCFGSFDASFGINTSHNSAPESDQSAFSETTDGNEEAAEEQFSSNQNTFAREEVDYQDNHQSATYAPENISSNEGGVSASTATEYNESKQETAPGGNQYPVAHTSPSYSFGFMPPIIGNQLAPFEGSEAQVRDVSRLPTFLVQQPFDPTSYYAQYYRSGADSDGRISPFASAGVATKYNGNLAVVSPQTSQSTQEGSPLVLSTAAPTALVNHATGVLQSSMAVTQQPLSVFRPPTGLHLPHYHPNYIPYGHYFPPFYVPPPTIHQFLSNGAFPQQPQGGSVYPNPPAPAAKYSLPQYKPGTHTNNSSHVGMPGSYGPYGSSLTTAAGNSTSNEDLAASHFKESNAYASGQQSEGSGVWIAPTGRDMSSLQASSFYNLPQGQMAFAPAQPSHGTYAGVYHPAQPVNATTVHPLLQQSQTMAGPVDMVGPTANVYQQPQHSQINWPNNF